MPWKAHRVCRVGGLCANADRAGRRCNCDRRVHSEDLYSLAERLPPKVVGIALHIATAMAEMHERVSLTGLCIHGLWGSTRMGTCPFDRVLGSSQQWSPMRTRRPRPPIACTLPHCWRPYRSIVWTIHRCLSSCGVWHGIPLVGAYIQGGPSDNLWLQYCTGSVIGRPASWLTWDPSGPWMPDLGAMFRPRWFRRRS